MERLNNLLKSRPRLIPTEVPPFNSGHDSPPDSDDETSRPDSPKELHPDGRVSPVDPQLNVRKQLRYQLTLLIFKIYHRVALWEHGRKSIAAASCRECLLLLGVTRQQHHRLQRLQLNLEFLSP